MSIKRRPCRRCGRNRAEKFFTSVRGHTCTQCRKKGPADRSKDTRLRDTYGISLEEWTDIFVAQGSQCAICKGVRTTYDTDHDHKLAKTDGARASVRGLLCKRCNRRLLPACLDKKEILYAAIEYLDNPPAREVLAP